VGEPLSFTITLPNRQAVQYPGRAAVANFLQCGIDDEPFSIQSTCPYSWGQSAEGLTFRHTCSGSLTGVFDFNCPGYEHQAVCLAAVPPDNSLFLTETDNNWWVVDWWQDFVTGGPGRNFTTEAAAEQAAVADQVYRTKLWLAASEGTADSLPPVPNDNPAFLVDASDAQMISPLASPTVCQVHSYTAQETTCVCQRRTPLEQWTGANGRPEGQFWSNSSATSVPAGASAAAAAAGVAVPGGPSSSSSPSSSASPGMPGGAVGGSAYRRVYTLELASSALSFDTVVAPEYTSSGSFQPDEALTNVLVGLVVSATVAVSFLCIFWLVLNTLKQTLKRDRKSEKTIQAQADADKLFQEEKAAAKRHEKEEELRMEKQKRRAARKRKKQEKEQLLQQQQPQADSSTGGGGGGGSGVDDEGKSEFSPPKKKEKQQKEQYAAESSVGSIGDLESNISALEMPSIERFRDDDDDDDGQGHAQAQAQAQAEEEEEENDSQAAGFQSQRSRGGPVGFGPATPPVPVSSPYFFGGKSKSKQDAMSQSAALSSFSFGSVSKSQPPGLAPSSATEQRTALVVNPDGSVTRSLTSSGASSSGSAAAHRRRLKARRDTKRKNSWVSRFCSPAGLKRMILGPLGLLRDPGDASALRGYAATRQQLGRKFAKHHSQISLALSLQVRVVSVIVASFPSFPFQISVF
jgi:hypothetical protein